MKPIQWMFFIQRKKRATAGSLKFVENLKSRKRSRDTTSRDTIMRNETVKIIWVLNDERSRSNNEVLFRFSAKDEDRIHTKTSTGLTSETESETTSCKKQPALSVIHWKIQQVVVAEVFSCWFHFVVLGLSSVAFWLYIIEVFCFSAFSG